MNKVDNTRFVVQWDTHLPEPASKKQQSTSEKMQHVFYNVISVLIPIIGLARLASYGMKCLAQRGMLPARYYDEGKKAAWRSCSLSGHQIEEHWVQTPDGADIRVTVAKFDEKQVDWNKPTILYFNGSGAYAGVALNNALLQKMHAQGYNVVSFDYRGVDASTGEFTEANDLVIDGYSVVQWLLHQGVKKDQLHFYGLCLGGAVSVMTQALDPELTGKNVNERSFASTQKFIHAHADKVHLSCIATVVSAVLKNEGMSLDPSEQFEKIKGQKMVVYHAEDKVIPEAASLSRALWTNENQSAYLSIKLDDCPFTQGEDEWDDHHNTELEQYKGAMDKVIAFMTRKNEELSS